MLLGVSENVEKSQYDVYNIYIYYKHKYIKNNKLNINAYEII